MSSTNNNGNSNGSESGEPQLLGPQPDLDTIKMFVGQIPRNWDEEECKKMFEEFGPVFQLNILRDRNTNTSKGCCFVTFMHRKDALAAQNALHNIRVLPQMHHPVQMKPADSENQRKLFIGMLNKSMNEDEVRSIFQEFGQIEECTILRDDGRSRGCAFLTYVSRACAQEAIRKMHQSRTFEGCTKPIVVKFADTPKDKESKKSTLAALGLLGGVTGSRTLNPILQNATQNNVLAQLLQVLQGTQTAPVNQANAVTNQLLASLTSLIPLLTTAVTQNQVQQQSPQRSVPSSSSHDLSSLLQQQKLLDMLKSSGKDNNNQQLAQLLLNASQGNSSSSPPPSSRYNNESDYYQQQQQTLPAALSSQLQSFAQLTGGGSSSTPNNSLSANLLAAIAGSSGNQGGGGGDYASLLNANSFGGASGSAAVADGQSKGPDGCNLFIYHLPQDFTDNELNALFSLFGTVISAKVFIDKQTNMSKCFGFVSYDNASSAQRAISAMNGFQIGSKRLKVQLKRSDKDKPYQRGSGSPRTGGNVSPSTLVSNILGGQRYGYDE